MISLKKISSRTKEINEPPIICSDLRSVIRIVETMNAMAHRKNMLIRKGFVVLFLFLSRDIPFFMFFISLYNLLN